MQHQGGLALNNTYTVTQTFALSGGLTGPYYVIVSTDTPSLQQPFGAVIESNEGNNASASMTPIIIDLPPPADLIVSAASFE